MLGSRVTQDMARSGLFLTIYCGFLAQITVLLSFSALARDVAGEAVISADACQAIQIYTPDPSVAYVPGVDVDGQSVAPADLPDSGSLTISEQDISIDLRVPLSQFFAIPAGLQPVIGDALIGVGQVTLRDGTPYLGDKRLTGPQQSALAQACAEALARQR